MYLWGRLSLLQCSPGHNAAKSPKLGLSSPQAALTFMVTASDSQDCCVHMWLAVSIRMMRMRRHRLQPADLKVALPAC